MFSAALGALGLIAAALIAWQDSNYHPRFPFIREGRRVTVMVNGVACRATMWQISRNSFRHYATDWMRSYPWNGSLPTGSPYDRCFFMDEGVTWCLGWKGKNVDALKAANAL